MISSVANSYRPSSEAACFRTGLPILPEPGSSGAHEPVLKRFGIINTLTIFREQRVRRRSPPFFH